MKGNKISDHDHVGRYCKPSTIEDGQILATAFMSRTGEESLSVNWLEYLNCSSREHEIAEILQIYSQKLKVGARAKVAIINVGEVRQKVLKESPDKRNLEVLHDPIDDPIDDPSHSGIYNLRHDDELIFELILETVQESYLARIKT